jgi:hypothetical protein
LKKKLKEFDKSMQDGARMQIMSEAQAVELKRELEDLKRQSGAREEQAVDRQEQRGAEVAMLCNEVGDVKRRCDDFEDFLQQGQLAWQECAPEVVGLKKEVTESKKKSADVEKLKKDVELMRVDMESSW